MDNNYLLDEHNWRLEAESVINDIKNHVYSITLSEKLQNTNKKIFLNLITLENQTFCIELSGQGFRIVGKSFDTTDINCSQYYETPYSLLNNVSPMFSTSFGNELIAKLQNYGNEY
ncbi:hypothetical protein WA026_000769 [Henosepilachna vigintioctopunctata]|uniref:GSKIP domain-containing protein n=1 Tax=Henosepilachna vigintioctopunctata TaxID=420089 RepID=A0AAW1V0B2_9CUCU